MRLGGDREFLPADRLQGFAAHGMGHGRHGAAPQIRSADNVIEQPFGHGGGVYPVFGRKSGIRV